MLPQQVIRQYPPISNTRRPTLSMTIHCKGKGPQQLAWDPGPRSPWLGVSSGEGPHEEADSGVGSSLLLQLIKKLISRRPPNFIESPHLKIAVRVPGK